MPLLPILVSIFTFNKRKENRDAQNVDDNVKNPSENGKPPHRGIDIPESETLDSSNLSSLDKPVPYRTDTRGRPLRRRLSISTTSVAVVKKPYNLSRRALRAVHSFVFDNDNEVMEGYAPKYRYLPIVSGLVVPLSILLEVPGLTEHWYQRQDGLEIIEYQANPQILEIGLGFSIASALLANICLIMRFLEKRVGSSTLAAICLLLVHDIINITALVSFGVIHAVNDGFTYSQAYYVTLASTIASLSVTITLAIDYFRTPDFIKSGSGLTRKQRSLVIIVMILLCYLGFGALIYCYMMGLHFLDALYFCVCSSLTIGFGDLYPANTSAQIFSIFYNTFGILNTGLAIAIARETIIEAFQHTYRHRKHALAMRRKMHRHVHAKHHGAKHGIWLTSHRINDHLPDGVDIPVSSTPPTPPPELINDVGSMKPGQQEQKPRDGSPTPSVREKEAGAEELIDDPYHAEKLEETIGDENDPTPEATPKEPAESPTLKRLNTGLSGKSIRSRSLTMSSRTPSRTLEKDDHVKSPEESQDVGDTVTAEREEAQEQVKKVDDHMVAGFGDEEVEYIKFRQDMIREEQKEFKAKLWVSWGLFVIFWVFGGVIFMLSEGWSYGIAIYFCFTAFSTIGYGDYAPKTGPGRVCFVAWSLLGVGTMTILVSVLSEAYQSRYSTMMHNGLFDKAIRSYQNKTHTKKLASHPDTPTYDTETMTVGERRMALDETRVHMAEIPPKIIAQAKVFHAHLQYVLTHNNQERPPPGLQRALDELMDEEAMNEDLRKEVLQDGEARRTLFMMSFERTLKRMVENAERVSKLIEERDTLEEGLGWGIDRADDEILGAGDDDDEDEDEDEDEEDDTYPDSPEDMGNVEGSFDILASEARDPSKKKSTAMTQWLKLRAGIMLTPRSRRSQLNPNMPYLHASGSQSEPHLATTGEEEENNNDPNCGDGSKDKNGGASGSGSGSMTPGKRHHRPRQPSKLSAVRFADNPYGDHRDPTGEGDAIDNVVKR